MTQHDYNIANDTAANVRGDINDALGAIRSNNSGSSAPAATVAGQWWYDTTNDKLYIRNDANTAWNQIAYTPSGIMQMWGGSGDPDGWLVCNGRSLSTTTYADLHTAIGYTYGGSGGNFNIPDLMGRTPIGAGTGTGLTARTRGQKSGAETHTLTVPEMPSHNHTISPSTVNGTQANGGTFGAGGGGDSATLTIGNTGGGTAHNNMQPFTVIQFIIKI